MTPKRQEANGRISYVVPACAGMPQKRFHVTPECDEAAAFALSWEYAGEMRRAADILDAEIKALTLDDLRTFVLARRLLPKGVTLRRWVEDIYAVHVEPITIRRAMDLFLTDLSNRGRSPIYQGQARQYLRPFVDAFGEDRVLSVSRAGVREFLLSLGSDSTHNKVRSLLSSFYSFCISRNFTLENLADAVPPREVRRKEYIPFHDARATEAFLMNVFLVDPEMIHYYCLQLFAGLRPHEARGLPTPRAGDYLRISPARSKTRSARTAPILPPLRSLLTFYPPYGPEIFYTERRDERVRAHLRSIGMDTSPDILRHTYASHRFPLVGEVELARDMGNTPAMIFRHYRGVVTPEEGRRYFDLDPVQYLGRKPREEHGVGGVLGELPPGDGLLRKEEEVLLVPDTIRRELEPPLPYGGANLYNPDSPDATEDEKDAVQERTMPAEGDTTCGAIPLPVVPDILNDNCGIGGDQ